MNSVLSENFTLSVRRSRQDHNRSDHQDDAEKTEVSARKRYAAQFLQYKVWLIMPSEPQQITRSCPRRQT